MKKTIFLLEKDFIANKLDKPVFSVDYIFEPSKSGSKGMSAILHSAKIIHEKHGDFDILHICDKFTDNPDVQIRCVILKKIK